MSVFIGIADSARLDKRRYTGLVGGVVRESVYMIIDLGQDGVDHSVGVIPSGSVRLEEVNE